MVIVTYGRSNIMTKLSCDGSSPSLTSFFPFTVPTMIVHPLQNETFLEGAHLIMTCISLGVPAPTFQWTKNGNASIPRAEQYGSSAILSIIDLKYEDQGLYECTASNIGGESKTSSFVSVKGEVNIDQIFL